MHSFSVYGMAGVLLKIYRKGKKIMQNLEGYIEKLNNIKTLAGALSIARGGDVWGVVNDSNRPGVSGYIELSGNLWGGRLLVYIDERGATVRDGIKWGGSVYEQKLNDRAAALLLAAIEVIDRERWGAVRAFYNSDCGKWGVQEWTRQSNGGRGWAQIDPEKASGAVYTPVEGVAKRWARELAKKYRRALFIAPSLIIDADRVQNS